MSFAFAFSVSFFVGAICALDFLLGLMSQLCSWICASMDVFGIGTGNPKGHLRDRIPYIFKVEAEQLHICGSLDVRSEHRSLS